MLQYRVETPTVIRVTVCQTTYKHRVEAKFGSEELTVIQRQDRQKVRKETERTNTEQNQSQS